jgi:hypothetical protein
MSDLSYVGYRERRQAAILHADDDLRSPDQISVQIPERSELAEDISAHEDMIHPEPMSTANLYQSCGRLG